MPRNRKLLLLTKCFPPLLSVSGKRAYHFARYLPEYGWDAIVVTAPLPKAARTDSSLDLTNIRVVDRLLPRFWPQPHVSYVAESRPIPARRFATDLWRGFKIPLGHDVASVPLVLPNLLRICTDEGVSAVFATGGPPSTLVLGACVASLAAVPLCLDFRDPWTLNYLQNDKNIFVRWCESIAERAVCRRAELIVFSSTSCCEMYRQIYKPISKRMVPIYTGYDSSRLPPSGPKFDSFTMIHFGNCYGARDLSTILHALHFLQQRSDCRPVKLLNFGRIHAEDLELSNRLGLGEVLECRPAVDYRSGLSLLQAADLLLLLGYGDEKAFIPAKTFDYLLAGRPILCMTRCSELAAIVRDANAGWVVRPGDYAAAASAMTSAVAATTSPTRLFAHNRSIQYEATSSAATLAALLDNLISPSGCR